MSDVDVPTDDLVALLRGDLDRARLAEVSAHLRGCADCRRELADVAAVHGSLEAARRVLHPAVAGEPAAVEPADDDLLPPLQLPRRRPAQRWLAVAAAALIAVGIGSAALVVNRQDTGPAGETEMTISTHDLPDAGTGHFYYAWLLDPTTNKMLPLGQVSPTTTAHFEVPSDLLTRYHAVDISLQADDGNPAHSDTSVLRATY